MVRIAPGTKPWDALMETVLDGIEGKADAALAGLEEKLDLAQNLADLPDKDEARSVLDVYTKAESEALSTVNGIESITLASSVGLVDTYDVALQDGSIEHFQVHNGAAGPAGRGINSIVLLSTSGLTKTYRITYTDGSTFDYSVLNGADGKGVAGVALLSTVGSTKTYRMTFSDGSFFDYVVTNGTAGTVGPSPTLRSTSTTSRSIATGSKQFDVTEMPVAFQVGMVVRATSDADPNNYMAGMVTAATTTSVTLNVTEIGGSGTKTDWTLALGAFRGVAGPQGSANIFGPAGSVPGPYPDGTVTYEY